MGKDGAKEKIEFHKKGNVSWFLQECRILAGKDNRDILKNWSIFFWKKSQ